MTQFWRRANAAGALLTAVMLGWGAAMAEEAGAPERLSAPDGCEAIATIVYDACVRAHVFGCVQTPELVRILLEPVDAGGGVIRREAGLVVTSLEGAGWRVDRLLNAQDAAARALQLEIGDSAEWEFVEMSRTELQPAPRSREGRQRVTYFGETTLALETGPETVSIYGSETYYLGEDELSNAKRFYSYDLGVEVGAAVTTRRGEVVSRIDRTPLSIHRPGDADFLVTAPAHCAERDGLGDVGE